MAEQHMPDIASLEQAVRDAQVQLEQAQQHLNAAKQTAAQTTPAASVQPPASAAAPPAQTAAPAATPPVPTRPSAPTYYSATQQSYYVAPVGYQPYQQAQPGQSSQSIPQSGQPYYQPSSSAYGGMPPQSAPVTKDHIVAGLLAIFLGCFGVHKFYLGYNTAGVIMLCVSVVGGLLTLTFASGVMMLVGVIEGIIYLSKSQYDFEQTYVVHKKEWF